MRQFARLRRLRVLQQRTSRRNRRLQAFRPKTSERGNLELLAEQATRRVEIEIPVRLTGARRIVAEIGRPTLRIKDFCRTDTFQLRWSQSFGQPPGWNKLRPVPGFWF